MSKNNRLSRKLTQDNFVTEKIDVIQNNLLGSYNDDGTYVIAPQIIEELIELEKVKKTAFGNSIFCVGNLLGYGELVFELLFDSQTTGNNAAATLYLLEDVDKINGYLQNIIKTKIEDFNRNVDNFIEATYQHFNIVTSDDDDDEDEGMERKLLDDLEDEDSFIIAKKQYSLMLSKLFEEKYLDAYGKYFTYRMSVLTKLNNEFSTSVLDSFNRQYALIENVFLHEKNYKVLNELLDKCVEEISGTNEQFLAQEQDFLTKTAPALETFTDSMSKLSDRFETKALNMLAKDDREKVEEILEDLEDSQNSSRDNVRTRESRPNAQQIANEVKTNSHSQESTNIAEQPKTEVKKEQASEYIKDMIDNKKQAKESLYASIQQSHGQSKSDGTNMTGNNYAPSGSSYTGATAQSDNAPNENLRASSLKDRINRLQKFKEESQSMEERSTPSDDLGSVFDILSKEKEKKSSQVEEKNIRSRETIDNINDDTKLSQYLKQKHSLEKSFDEMDFER